MRKLIQIQFGSFYYNEFSRPIRDKKDIVLLLLNTLNALEIERYTHSYKGNAVIKIDKTSRIFYFLDNKYFSIVFPFLLEKRDEEDYYIIDSVMDVEINSRLISLMKNMVDRMNLFQASVEDFLEEAYFDLFDEGYSEEHINICWNIIMRLLIMEAGYVRYEHDYIHQNRDLHPLNHLDINYSSRATYKLGLNKKLKPEEFRDLLDVQTRCRYIM